MGVTFKPKGIIPLLIHIDNQPFLCIYSNMVNNLPVPYEEESSSLLARIPLLAGDSKKMEYLSYRATGFPVRQACELAGIPQRTVNKWRRTDVEFATFEGARLPELQRLVGRDVLRLDFMRNFKLILMQDAEVIWKAKNSREEMTDRDWSYFRQIRKHYTAGEFLNLEKALAPEKHRSNTVIKLSFGSTGNMTLEEESYTEGEFSEL